MGAKDDGGYGDSIHDAIDDIPLPNDDSITISSFENSQMTYSKSFNKPKKSRKRHKMQNVSLRKFMCNFNIEIFNSHPTKNSATNSFPYRK
jgi:hypothetical protein